MGGETGASGEYVITALLQLMQKKPFVQISITELCRKAGAEAEEVCVGLSALDGPGDPATRKLLASEEVPAERLDLQSDAYAALMAFTRGGPGMIVICGTGSMLLLADAQGRQTVRGGWGYLLEDTGSGYAMARDALIAVSDEADGVGEKSVFTPLALEYFGAGTPRALIDALYAPACTPDRIAGFARHVLEEAGRGCEEAQVILFGHMHVLAVMAAALAKTAPEVTRVGLYGGVFAHSEAARESFRGALASRNPDLRVCPLEYPPEMGAVIHLLRKRGALSEEVLGRMKESCGEEQA